MSQSPDNLRDPVADFPNPELNPLLNPVLGRHLERWTKLYFTTPAEKRDEAVLKLIEELKAEEASQGIPINADSAADTNETYAIVCPRCQRSNLRSQKYCGMCGTLMPVRAQAAAASGGGAVVGSAMFEQEYGTEERVAENTAAIEEPERREKQPESQSPFAATSLLFQPAVKENSRWDAAEGDQTGPESDLEYEPEDSDPVDIDWLRDRNRFSEAEERSGIQNYLMVIAVLICIGILVFLLVIRPRYSGKNVAKQKAPVNWNISQNAPTTLPSVGQNEGAASTGEAAQEAEPPKNGSIPMESLSAKTPSKPKPSAPHVPPATEPSGSTSAPPSVEANQGGAAELAVAKDYLSGKNGPPDGAAAAKMLWAAIAKKNGPALLLLSDLYASGNGVPKSCDQARLLVDAALRKDVPEADIRLRNLQAMCP